MSDPLAPPTLHPLIARLVESPGVTRLDLPAQLDAWLALPGTAVLFFTEDPARIRETLDVAVILPELVRGLCPHARVGVLMPELANARAATYGIRRWPGMAFLRDGAFLGTVEGLRDWSVYVQLVGEALAAEPRALPPRTIPIAAATGGCPTQERA